VEYFIGDLAIPSGSVIGTNSWEVPDDPKGFYPFTSSFEQSIYGAYFARRDIILVLIGTINYGEGIIILDATYHVDDNNAFSDMLFYNMISFNKHRG